MVLIDRLRCWFRGYHPYKPAVLSATDLNGDKFLVRSCPRCGKALKTRVG